MALAAITVRDVSKNALYSSICSPIMAVKGRIFTEMYIYPYKCMFLHHSEQIIAPRLTLDCGPPDTKMAPPLHSACDFLE